MSPRYSKNEFSTLKRCCISQNRFAANVASSVPDRSVPEPGRFEDKTMPQIEPVIDGRLESTQIRHLLFQPTKRLAQPRIDRLETLGVGMRVGRFADRPILSVAPAPISAG